MADANREALHDRRLVPADQIQRYHIATDAPKTPPTVGIFDEPTRCYKANEEWVKHIMGAVSLLGMWTAWTGEEDDRNAAVQEIAEFMIGEVCGMFLLRQSPTNSCLLEQSVDGGVIWTPAFDYSSCLSGINIAITTIYNVQSEIVVATQINIYLADPGAYAPDVEDDSAGTDAAYCYALRGFIEGALAGVIERKEAENERNTIIMAVGEAIAIVAAFYSGGLISGVSATVGAAITLIIDSVIDALNLAGLKYLQQDENQLNQLVCCAYEVIQGDRILEATWNTLWSGTTCTGLSTEAEEFRPILNQIAQDFDSYVMFLDASQEAVELYDAGILADNCIEGCGEEWVADFLGGDGWDALLVLLPVSSGAQCTYNSGTDEIDGACIGDGTYEGIAFKLDVGPNTVITAISTTVDVLNTRGTWNLATKWNDVNQNTKVGDSPTGSTEVMAGSGYAFSDGELRFYHTSMSVTCAGGAYLRQVKFQLTGTGVNPFA